MDQEAQKWVSGAIVKLLASEQAAVVFRSGHAWLSLLSSERKALCDCCRLNEWHYQNGLSGGMREPISSKLLRGDFLSHDGVCCR